MGLLIMVFDKVICLNKNDRKIQIYICLFMFQKEFDNIYYYNNEGDLMYYMYCKKKYIKVY